MPIDCDIHVGYETVLDLAPYPDPATRELVVNCGTNGLGMPSYPWYHPTGWLRNDAFDRASTAVGAQLVGQTLDRVRANVLEPLALDHGVLTPDEAAAFSILPNGILAAHLSRAYNDWLLEHWLEPEPRLRGLVVVAAQRPGASARRRSTSSSACASPRSRSRSRPTTASWAAALEGLRPWDTLCSRAITRTGTTTSRARR